MTPLAEQHRIIQQFAVEGLQLPEFPAEGAAVETLFHRLADDFIQSIELDHEPFVSGTSAQPAVEVVDAIYKTAGQPIRLG